MYEGFDPVVWRRHFAVAWAYAVKRAAGMRAAMAGRRAERSEEFRLGYWASQQDAAELGVRMLGCPAGWKPSIRPEVERMAEWLGHEAAVERLERAQKVRAGFPLAAGVHGHRYRMYSTFLDWVRKVLNGTGN